MMLQAMGVETKNVEGKAGERGGGVRTSQIVRVLNRIRAERQVQQYHP